MVLSSHVSIIKAHFVVNDINMRMCSKDNLSIHIWNKLSDGEPKPYSIHSQFVSILNITNNHTQCRLQYLSSNCRWTLKLTNMFGWIRRHLLKWPPEATRSYDIYGHFISWSPFALVAIVYPHIPINDRDLTIWFILNYDTITTSWRPVRQYWPFVRGFIARRCFLQTASNCEVHSFLWF